ncbi:bifunctional pyr operon transcriptional regulator/uracil phosphoribosyltransferase PyrR [Ectothiorhodospiraceae bacterium WFHF3C12]|nr:bifunctional pyr operon transcriptional regulator/uracil phosphoribosyltransferase PyrR [Ectothiorhodospiraceae bacterium WFHF3C12]
MTEPEAVEPLLDRMAESLRALFDEQGVGAPHPIGIHTGGVWVARGLQQRLGLEGPMGELDITFYRDDFSRIGLHPRVRPSALPFTVEGANILLVDDVIFSGRTIRAALNEIFDYGRPARVMLAVLVDRGGRELPIEPAVAGTRLTLPAGARVKLRGPDPLALQIQQERP